MAVDIISITALIISVIGAVGLFVKRTHLQHIVCCKCIESDCKNNNNENIDIENVISVSPKIVRKEVIEV